MKGDKFEAFEIPGFSGTWHVHKLTVGQVRRVQKAAKNGDGLEVYAPLIAMAIRTPENAPVFEEPDVDSLHYDFATALARKAMQYNGLTEDEAKKAEDTEKN